MQKMYSVVIRKSVHLQVVPPSVGHIRGVGVHALFSGDGTSLPFSVYYKCGFSCSVSLHICIHFIELRVPEVWFYTLKSLREQSCSIIIRNGWKDDDVITMCPVRGRRHPLCVRQLETVDHAKQLIEVSAGTRRLGNR